MKIFIFIVLFFICGIFIAFSQLMQPETKAITGVLEPKIERFFTKYNPDFERKGMMKSSFKHELVPLYSK